MGRHELFPKDFEVDVMMETQVVFSIFMFFMGGLFLKTYFGVRSDRIKDNRFRMLNDKFAEEMEKNNIEEAERLLKEMREQI